MLNVDFLISQHKSLERQVELAVATSLGNIEKYMELAFHCSGSRASEVAARLGSDSPSNTKSGFTKLFLGLLFLATEATYKKLLMMNKFGK